MSNYNNPIGLTPISPNPRINIFTAGSSALAKGDVVGLNPSTKVVEFFAPATHFFPIGVMASACAASGEARVITDPNCEYWAQFEGDFNAITSIGAYDLKGTTGVHEINGAAQIWGSVEVLGHFPIPGSDETGSNAKVRCRLAQGRIPGGVAVHKMIVRPGQWTDETLTGARAVTKADGDLAVAANHAAADLTRAIGLLRPRHEGLTTEVLQVSSPTGVGIPDVWDHLVADHAVLRANGALARLRADQAAAWLWDEIGAGLTERFRADPVLVASSGIGN